MDRDAVLHIMRRHDDRLLAECRGAIGVDVGIKEVRVPLTRCFPVPTYRTERHCIIVYVKKKLPQQELTANEAVPEQIEGVPTDVIECCNVWARTPSSQFTGRSKTDPLVGGLSISNAVAPQYAGTLGIIGNVKGAPTALSCAHVMVESLPGTGTAIMEPAGSTDTIGKVSATWYGDGSNVDAALAPIKGRNATVGYVANIGQIVQMAAPAVGQKVMKMGISTGKTEGTITSTTLTVKNEGQLGPITLKNQIQVEPGSFSAEGDSGSVLVATVDGKLSVVGMVQGGNDQYIHCNSAVDFPFVMTF